MQRSATSPTTSGFMHMPSEAEKCKAHMHAWVVANYYQLAAVCMVFRIPLIYIATTTIICGNLYMHSLLVSVPFKYSTVINHERVPTILLFAHMSDTSTACCLVPSSAPHACMHLDFLSSQIEAHAFLATSCIPFKFGIVNLHGRIDLCGL